MNSDLVVIGSFVVGATVRLPRMPHPGETLVADLFDLGPGGKGSNLAITAARQGIKASVVLRVGEDSFADMAFGLYKREGVDAHYVRRTLGESTSIGLVYLQENGENTIGLYRGANWRLSIEDIDDALPTLQGAKLLATQFEVPDAVVLRALEIARTYGLKTILNPAPARTVSSTFFQDVDILTPNEGEAKVLLGLPVDYSTVRPEDLADQLLKCGPKAVIITLGSRGCLVAERDKKAVSLPAYPVDVIDTVGAGDAFNGGLASALLQGYTLVEAAIQATVTAALSATAVGALGHLPSSNEVEAHKTRYREQLRLVG